MDLLGTDATKVASSYSAFAGVLAGFVFAVMGYLLGSRKLGGSQAEREDLETALSWAVIAFVGLSLASFIRLSVVGSWGAWSNAISLHCQSTR